LERIRFKSGSYWDLEALLTPTGSTQEFKAQMTHLDNRRLATGKDFDESTGKLKKPDAVVLLGKEEAKDLERNLLKADWTVSNIEKKKQQRSPAPPFITSTLQQEANRKFGYSARDTMRIAQKLYENGYITYMRTDSTNLSRQAISAARNAVSNMYGEDYLYKSVRTYNKKSKGAQEAHEAIRPAGSHFISPSDARLKGREQKLYDLIWKRTVATQMANAQLEFTNVTIEAENEGTHARFKANGKVIIFPGYFRAYVEGSDDPDAALENQEIALPPLNADDQLDCNKISSKSHETKPPARFTEASLVKELEKDGVGRPSTYATIISTIQDRGYVEKEGSALVPTFTAFAVTELLENHFPDLVDINFTSEMEDKLDEIAHGNEDWIRYMDSFYKGDDGLKSKVDEQESQIVPQDAKRIDLPIEGIEGMDIFIGKFGPYVQSQTNSDVVSTSIPMDLTPSDITVDKLKDLIKASEDGPNSIGKDPETGMDIYVLTGRYGPYVQLGLKDDENKKPKRVSLLKGMKPEDVDLSTALKLLSLPRSLGEHPDTGKEIKAGVGRYGPFVVHDGKFASLTKDDNVLEIERDRAIELLELSEKRKKKKSSSLIKELGSHPEDGKEVKVMDGRYGPYIKHGKKNISLPNSLEPDKLTMKEAVELISKKKK
jgi:DNA topoisomerase-1